MQPSWRSCEFSLLKMWVRRGECVHTTGEPHTSGFTPAGYAVGLRLHQRFVASWVVITPTPRGAAGVVRFFFANKGSRADRATTNTERVHYVEAAERSNRPVQITRPTQPRPASKRETTATERAGNVPGEWRGLLPPGDNNNRRACSLGRDQRNPNHALCEPGDPPQ